jgi:hypothetical protein
MHENCISFQKDHTYEFKVINLKIWDKKSNEQKRRKKD